MNTDMFKKGTMLVGCKTGTRYEVIDDDIEMSYAILRPVGGKPFIVDWMTPAGTIRKEVFSSYKREE